MTTRTRPADVRADVRTGTPKTGQDDRRTPEPGALAQAATQARADMLALSHTADTVAQHGDARATRAARQAATYAARRAAQAHAAQRTAGGPTLTP